MPLYDFGCRACGERFEELQASDAPPPPCPACRGAETERRLAAFLRPRPAGGRDPSWTPAATRRDSHGHDHGHGHHH